MYTTLKYFLTASIVAVKTQKQVHYISLKLVRESTS